jgi:hypothetical protein
MELSMRLRAVLLLVVAVVATDSVSARQLPDSGDRIAALVTHLEEAGATGQGAAIQALAVNPTITGLTDFVTLTLPIPVRFVVKERDRTELMDGSQRLLLEVFVQRGTEAQISTWRADLVSKATNPADWSIAAMERLSFIGGLYHLELNQQKQYAVHNLTLQAPDLTLELPSGTAFVAETPDGPTAVVLMGRGKMLFAPNNPAEQTQIRIFAESDAIRTDFTAAFIRVSPGDFDWKFGKGALTPRAVSRRDVNKALEMFDEHIGQTFQLDLTDLSRERWSLTPAMGDIVAEIRTRKFDTLTYARSTKDPEDISLFDRKRRRNISVYASNEKLITRGPSYSEDDTVDYDILDHYIEAYFQPDRPWIDGRSRMQIRIRSAALTTLTLRLAESLTVRSITSPELGRLLHLRVVGQNSVIINLPTMLRRNTELALLITYSGRIEPQSIEREAIAAAGPVQQEEAIQIRVEPQFLFSNRSYWYPQATVTDYATGELRIIVPQDYDAVATGRPAGPWAPAPGPVEPGQRARKMFVFLVDRPARYFACVISRFSAVTTAQVTVPSISSSSIVDGDGHAKSENLSLIVLANPRQTGRARSLAERTASIIEYYASLLGDAPYPSFTLAVGEAELPGGHSPPYFAVLNQTLPMSPFVWRNDPVSFDNYPTFFLAHELAHQWWGQAVGWKNYHEQWISEGLAQYFAALYAAEERGDDLLANLLRQMRRWGIEQSSQGPIHLGYRLGHIKADGRVFRAIIYNKAAMVMHMLRRFIGDDVFFRGMRRFYAESRFRKTGTEEFRTAMESAGATGLEPFFDAWIYGTAIPELRFSYSVDQESAVLRFEHKREVVPVPVTVTVTYTNGDTEEHVITVLERAIERTLSLRGPVRKIEVNRDNAALAEFTR